MINQDVDDDDDYGGGMMVPFLSNQWKNKTLTANALIGCIILSIMLSLYHSL